MPCSATDEAWRLLSSYLERYPSQNSLYHRCVINKLLAHGIPLPNWLINSYKVRTGRASPPGMACVVAWAKKAPRQAPPEGEASFRNAPPVLCACS